MPPIPAGWKPISSAPKDGTPVLLFARHIAAEASTRVVGWFNADYGWIAQSFIGQPFARLIPSQWAELLPFPGSPASVAPGDAQDEKQIARWKRDSELLLAIQNACWDVRFISHSNGDDYDIGIEIVSHFMQPPCERVIGENWHEDLRAALEQAMTAKAYPPARPERAAAPAAGDALDAARYRWLRDHIQEDHSLPGSFWLSDTGGESWDKTIDAAMDYQRQQGEAA